jgi:SAM-dependent methyltransferase
MGRLDAILVPAAAWRDAVAPREDAMNKRAQVGAPGEAIALRKPRSRIYDGAFFGRMLDPFNSDLHGFVAAQVEPGARVLEVGCGTGALAFRLAAKAAEVVGVELSPAMIAYARRRNAIAATPNVSFVLGDVAGALAGRPEASFELATLVLVLHEMPAETRPGVLREAARLARRVLCLDYSVPLPRTPLGLLYRGLELAAGLEHFRAFRDFSARGGTEAIALSAGLSSRRLRTVAAGCIDVCEVRR